MRLGLRSSAARACGAGLLLAAAAVSAPVPADYPTSADELAPARVVGHSAPVTPFVIDIDLANVPAPAEWRPGDPVSEVPRRRYLPPGLVLPLPDQGVDPLLSRQLDYGVGRRAVDAFTTPSRNFVAIPYTGAGVPDTVGDVGPNHIVAATNGGGTRVRIWDKAEPTPNVLTTFDLDTLGTGACASGFGDPVVIYDRQADRWVLMEFVTGGNDLCVYVSQTPDPVSGGWYAYDFVPASFPDYPKLSVWPTDENGGEGSYVVTANAGVAVYAMERGAMLAGDAAGFQIFDLPSLPGFSFQTSTPADIDGPDSPPAGAPAVVMRHRDTEVHNGPNGIDGDVLEHWALSVDWDTPANSSIVKQPDVVVADFSSELCGLTSFSCIQQPGTSVRLDPLREVVMHRLQYYNHGAFETLVGNFVIDVSGTEQGGIRWFELRRDGDAASPWTLYQEGTWSIDDDSRWMGASSIDQSGNIALGYNVGSSNLFPGLRYTGRLADDPLGVMTAGETSIVEGAASSGTNRYGDYAAMGLDPADDCTFWFVGEYNVASTWTTRWASFRFEQCGCELAPSPLDVGAQAGFNEVELTWTDADLATVEKYEIRRSRQSGGPYDTVAVVADLSPGIAGADLYTYVDETVSGDIEYYYVVVASDDGACRSDTPQETVVTPQGICFLAPLFDGLAGADLDLSSTCGVSLSWAPALPECGSRVLYNVYRSTDPAFVPGPASLIASGIDDTSTLDRNDLVSNVEYTYVVRAVDVPSGAEDLNLARRTVVAGGSGGMQTVFAEDFEDAAAFAADWTVTTGPNFHRCGEWDVSTLSARRPSGGSGQYAIANSFDCSQVLPATSASMDSPAIDLSDPFLANVVLEADILYDHDGNETGTIEVWDGSQWDVVWTDPNTDVDTRVVIDVSAQALGNPAFRVRFNYQSANLDRWFSVDDVRIGVDLVCETAPAPAPAPDGASGTAPLRGRSLSVLGDSIEVTWDAAACASPGFNLLYGDLADVATHALSGSECGLGGSGAYVWSDVPAGDLYFLVVGTDGATTESSWGEGTLGERHGLTPSGECGIDSKTVAGTCPN